MGLAVLAHDPRTQPEPPPEPAPERVPVPAPRERLVSPRVLVVEDDSPSLRSISRGLRGKGFLVLGAQDGRAALAAIREVGADVVVTDIFMPNMDGLDLILNIVLERPELPVIAFTGAPRSNPCVRSALLYGAKDVLMKPFGTDDLVRAIDRVLGR